MNKLNNNRHTSKQVADIIGINKRTLFNWEEAKKIPKAKRDPMNNYRYYTKSDIAILRKITKR